MIRHVIQVNPNLNMRDRHHVLGGFEELHVIKVQPNTSLSTASNTLIKRRSDAVFFLKNYSTPCRSIIIKSCSMGFEVRWEWEKWATCRSRCIYSRTSKWAHHSVEKFLKKETCHCFFTLRSDALLSSRFSLHHGEPILIKPRELDGKKDVRCRDKMGHLSI